MEIFHCTITINRINRKRPFLKSVHPLDQQLSLFKQAMQVWESYTCIKFVERKPEHSDYVKFTERKCGCCSFIGKKGGIQDISLAEGCAKLGLILHEYGHLIGL